MGECVVAGISTADGDTCDSDLLVCADVLVCEGGTGISCGERYIVGSLFAGQSCGISYKKRCCRY